MNDGTWDRVRNAEPRAHQGTNIQLSSTYVQNSVYVDTVR
jgi:hypothetical protein